MEDKVSCKTQNMAFSEAQKASDYQIPSEPVHLISNNVVFVTSKSSDQPVHTRRLITTFASRLNIL